MNDRRRRTHRVLGTEHGRQLRILNINELERCFGDLNGGGGDRCHLFADEADHALGEDRDILAHAAIARIGDIGANQHGVNAGQRLGAPHIDRDDARARMGAAQAPAEEHSRQFDIAGIAGAAGHLGHPVHAFDRLADGLAAQARSIHAITALVGVSTCWCECIGRLHHCKLPCRCRRCRIRSRCLRGVGAGQQKGSLNAPPGARAPPNRRPI